MIPEQTSSAARLACLGALITLSVGAHASEPAAPAPRPIPTPEQYEATAERFSNRLEEALEEPYVGITDSGSRQPGLYRIESTGVSTAPIVAAAHAFLATLSPAELETTTFEITDDEWRKWANQHLYRRAGLQFEQMALDQRKAVFALLSASLSARGLALSKDIMRLNHTLGELNNDNFLEYGEGKYYITVMGDPSATEPWGWQLDGHHLNLNYFVLGDQVVLSPAFWGSEPTVAHQGKYSGTRIMESEQAAGLALIQSLSPEQANEAILETTKPGNNILAQAFSDNLVLDYAGIRASALDDGQIEKLLTLIELYVDNLRDDHAWVRMEQVSTHLAETYFAWIGGTEDDSVFYYRIHSPVILIEFDHEKPVGLRHLYPDEPNHEHVHAVVRTPNGNDYGRDLLRQHYLEHAHD